MSELGVLSHRYDKSAHFSEELNESVLTIKMVYYKMHGYEKIGEEKIETSKDILIEIITEIGDNLDPKKTIIVPERRFISRNLLKTVYSNKRGRLKFYLEDLKKVAGHLKDFSKMTDDDIVILDELCAFGDNESSMIFRKLWLE